MNECRYHFAAYGADVCSAGGHSAAVVEVATGLARAIHGETGDEQIGWFIEDAETVVGLVGERPSWEVVDLGDDVRHDHRYFTISGLRFRTPDPLAEGWAPIEPVFTTAELTQPTTPSLPSPVRGEK